MHKDFRFELKSLTAEGSFEGLAALYGNVDLGGDIIEAGAFSKLFKDAKVHGGHAHRFRDTFACELLLDGTPIENVAAFLGHSDVRITQRHYAAWVRARQERAEADVKRSWERDPLVLMENEGDTRGTQPI